MKHDKNTEVQRPKRNAWVRIFRVTMIIRN